uniref:ZP domain-containing protein n=1 Tax=Stomoxys calcitrans TaxID=35570 RepID=A0A1I8PZK0_STOCA
MTTTSLVFNYNVDLSYFQHHHHIPHQQAIPVAFQPSYSGVYGPPPQPVYPGNPVGPSQVATPAPVAPVASSTTEFSLPEIVDNRSAKDERQFIPLIKQYLPPMEERPNYESPEQGNQDKYPFSGYNYQRPSTTPTTTTTRRPTSRPIVVEDLPPQVLPPIAPIIPAFENDEFDKPTFVSPTQGYDYSKPSTPAPVYLPASTDQQTLVQNTDPSIPPLRLRVHEMRCLQQTPGGGYFRTVLKVDSFIGATPTVDNDSSDKRCELKLHKSYVVIDLAGEDFTACGVQQCEEGLCLRLRFPAIRGMRTGSDSILTLHCKPQSRVAVKTHALKMTVVNEVQSRSLGTYAKGGSQNAFRTHVELLRKTPQGYARHVHGNEAVQLGEDLLLRAHVLAGDGWNFTKLTDVSLQRISPSGEMLNNVNLVTSQGCLNPSMKSICSQPPSYDAPLGYKLPFKAVMFQGMHSGEELLMTMRITGCLDSRDCQVAADQCFAPNGNLIRRKRDTLPTEQNRTEISEISKISFRVIMPGEHVPMTTADLPQADQSKAFILMGSIGFVALLVALGIFSILKLKK